MLWLIDFVVGALVSLGAVLCLAAAVGVLRAVDPFARIQAFAKAGTLGIALVLMGVAVIGGDFTVFMRALAAAALVLVNAALMAQVLAENSSRARADASDAQGRDSPA
ncbi:MAG: monovalent cation/H(+) antiporter subunit G [Alphaproteobacteria bacterium]